MALDMTQEKRKKESNLGRLDGRAHGNGRHSPQTSVGTALRAAGSSDSCLARPRAADPSRFIQKPVDHELETHAANRCDHLAAGRITAEAQTIEFNITALANLNSASLLNPGYSIFSGAVPNVSHNSGYYAGQSIFASWSPFASANASIIANGGALTEKWGEFRANANVTMTSATATSTMTYTGLFGANSTGNTITGSYLLGPGLYTLVVGGANSTDLAALLSHAIATDGDYTMPSAALTGYMNARLARNFNIQFSVTPVPLPAAAWLFGSGVVSVIALARRRSAV